MNHSNGEKHYGPHLGVLAIVFVSLFVGSLVILGVLTKGVFYPRPDWQEDLVKDYFNRFGPLVRIISFLQFGAAIPLGIFTATITSRLKFLGINAAGVNIAQFGGFASSVFLAISGLTGWVLSQPALTAAGNPIRAFQLFGFATGGVGHVTALGLLLAGISVTSGFARLIPRWLVWLGIITAVFAELSSLSLVFPNLTFFIPLGRFPGFIWMIGIGFTLTKSKKLTPHQ
ncbi:MAG TPA: hypothetical protein VNW49_14990 [Puia sp.]|nr:hypothetical protein [Puia sp.]